MSALPKLANDNGLNISELVQERFKCC